MRKTYEEIDALKKKLGVDTLWSWSRYHTRENDPYSYLLRYIRHIKPDRFDGRYGASGGCAHEILEHLYLNEIKYEDMSKEWDAQVMLLDMSNLKYNRADEEKNNKIAVKYESCVHHFFNNHVKVEAKAIVEEYIVCKIGEYWFNGYVDFMHIENQKLYITDFKTSTKYAGKKILEESGQLVLYAEAMRQRLKMPIEDIVIRWNFLKYTTVGEPNIKGEIKYRHVERHQIGESLTSKAKLHLKHFGCTEEEINNYVLQMISSNSIECLPEEIKSLYTFRDCYIEIPLSEDIVNDLKAEIIQTLDDTVKTTDEYERTLDDMLFYQPVAKENEYYYYNLCDYSRKLHKPWNDYLSEANMFNNEESEYRNDNSDNTIDDDMSWLDDLLGLDKE
jgi:hypothetical protein